MLQSASISQCIPLFLTLRLLGGGRLGSEGKFRAELTHILAVPTHFTSTSPPPHLHHQSNIRYPLQQTSEINQIVQYHLHRIKCDCTSFSSSSAIRPSSPSSTPINVSPTSLNSRLPSTNTFTRKTMPIMTDAQLAKHMAGRLGRGVLETLPICRNCFTQSRSMRTCRDGM